MIADNRRGMIVAHLQTLLPRGGRRPIAPVLARQRHKIRGFCREYFIPIHWWHIRAKGYVTVPTLEDLIAAGRVTA